MILLDSNIFIYHLTSHPTFGQKAKMLLTSIEKGEHQAIASFITYAEILTLPAKEKKEDLIRKYSELLLHFPHLRFCPVTENIAHRAAMLRGQHTSLKLMDTIILATAIEENAETLVTEDKILRIKNLPLQVLSLNEFFHSSIPTG